MNKASGSIHLDSLGAAPDYSDFEGHDSRRRYYDDKSYCANSDLFRIPSKLWGQRKLSDEEYERQAKAIHEFCRAIDTDTLIMDSDYELSVSLSERNSQVESMEKISGSYDKGPKLVLKK